MVIRVLDPRFESQEHVSKARHASIVTFLVGDFVLLLAKLLIKLFVVLDNSKSAWWEGGWGLFGFLNSLLFN